MVFSASSASDVSAPIWNDLTLVSIVLTAGFGGGTSSVLSISSISSGSTVGSSTTGVDFFGAIGFLLIVGVRVSFVFFLTVDDLRVIVI